MEAIANPWGALIVFLIVVGLLAALLLTKKRNLKISRDGVIASKNDDSEPLIPTKYAREILLLVQRSVEHVENLRSIEKKCLEKQMRHFEEVEITACGMLKAAFRNIVEQNKLEHNEAASEVSRFSAVLKSIMRDVKDMCRSCFINNHYYSMTSQEWDSYIMLKRSSIPQYISESTDNHWISTYISREKLREGFGKETAYKIEMMIEAIFNKAKSLSIDAYEKTQNEKAMYSEFTMRIAGHNPYENE